MSLRYCLSQGPVHILWFIHEISLQSTVWVGRTLCEIEDGLRALRRCRGPSHTKTFISASATQRISKTFLMRFLPGVSHHQGNSVTEE